MDLEFDDLTDPWTLLILRDAFQGVKRFEQWQERLGVARNVLAAQPAEPTEVSAFTYDPADPTPAVGGRGINPTIGGRRDNRTVGIRVPLSPPAARRPTSAGPLRPSSPN